ncbi:MAG: hypothetical protein GMKNLPBB_00818 [Myxococcota bacterium]|nr:hypothetical protein [Myxococcota bacterium]
MATLNVNDFTDGAVLGAAALNTAFAQVEDAVNGGLDDGNLSPSAGVANSKLASPRAYFLVTLSKESLPDSYGDADGLWMRAPPAPCTLVGAVARVSLLGGLTEVRVDVKENGVSVLAAPIAITAEKSPAAGTIADGAIAASANLTVTITPHAGTGTASGVDVTLIFKAHHAA